MNPQPVLEFYDVFVSSIRWFVGVLFGSLLGLSMALIAYHLGRLRHAFELGAGFLRAIPIIAMVPFAAKLVGVNELTKVGLIIWATSFPVFVATLGAVTGPIADIERRLSVARLSRWTVLRHFVFPRMFGGFVAGIEIAIGIGWLTVVAAELVGTDSIGIFRGGLGHATYTGMDRGPTEMAAVGLLIFGCLGLTTVLVWKRVRATIEARLSLASAE